MSPKVQSRQGYISTFYAFSTPDHQSENGQNKCCREPIQELSSLARSLLSAPTPLQF